MPCCSKSLCDTPVPDEVISESSEVVADCSVKSLDKTKYKSLKYRMLKNCKDKQILSGSDSSITPVITDKMETDFPIKSKDLSSNTIRSLYKDNESRVTDFAECDKTEAPRLDDIIERIRSLRPKKISEKDDILAVLKSGNEAFKQDISPTEEENVSQILPTSLDSARVGKESRMGASIAAGSVKIALPNGKIVKPKTLAEKRRLLRREFESDMRSKMQVNDQLLERQILRQKSNNRRPEYYDVRDKLLYDNAPMTRLSWIRATELPSANITFRQQYMMIDGRYVRICGSRGGSKRFLSPPPSSSDILEKKPAKIKQRLNSDQQSQFLPGPLCKKHLLIRKIPEMNNLYIRKKLPPIFLEVFPQFERPLEKIAESYLKIAFSNIVDNERARFASSALYNFENKEKFAFPLKYSDEQKEILCCLKEPIALPIEKSEVKLESLSDDSEIINDMLSEMFRCVETSLLDDSIIKLDPDAEAISKLPEIVSKSTLPESVSPERNTINYARKTALELRRLNVTVIEATECAANIAACCKEAYCHLGCVCSSLKCLTYSKRHCGNVECMFECTCEYTYRLRQKRSISQNNTSSIDEDDMLELKDRVCSGLAPVEAEFKHAVVVNQDHSVTLVDGETEKRKRSVKVPKRFNDYISSETMLPQPLSPIKHNEEIYEPRKINRTPIIPKEKLLLPRNLEVRLYNLKLEDVEPWCMVHELYKCFCDCMDAFGEPFGEGKCDNSLDQSDQNDDSTQNGHSIKTLNRTILLDTDEKNPLDKKNWHVELFSSDVEQETSSTVVEPVKRKIGPVISKYKDVSKKDSSVMRRKSNESLKRTRSSGNEEEKETVSKQPRIQIKSPWDLNQMVEQISGNKKDDEGSLLDEFALSTTSVVTEDAKFNKPPINGKNGVQAFVRQQLDDVKRSMRCARINQPYLPRNNRKDRTKRETQKRLAEIAAENANPTLLKRLQLLVKRSQISSMQRGLKLTSITNDMNDNKEQIELQPVKQMSLLGPPPLKPAPGARLLQKNVTNSDSQVLSITTKKESKTVNSVVNREILRMLNQKGALDAYFDISKPWMYHFQCLQWYKMLTSYKNNRINLWLEKNPAQHGTMALLTTSKNPPVPNCINMKTLEPAIAKRNVIDIPKFAIKIYSDCQKIHDPKHELQYVFMRAFPTHWTLEGVIEKGYKSKKENILDSNSALEIRNKKDDLEIKSFDETKKNSSSDIKTDIIQSSDKRKSLPNFVKKRIHTGKQNAVVKKRRLTQESQCNKSNSSSESDIKTDITKNIESKNASNSEPVIDKISNSANTSDIIASNDSSLENTSKMEELPFLIGMRYLFVSMKEKFSLLTSIRNGYRVTYNQLENAIETANSRKVYVRLKFKQNDLNSDQRGTVFAVPWCNDGVFIGPYGLSEQCMITKQIYWRNRILALTDYVRAVQNKDPKPVGYWMCYYGDDKKFIISYKNLAKRIDCLENNPNDSKLDDTSAEPIKVTSPNSLLKTNLSRKNSPPMLINKALQPEQKLITTPKLIKEDVISKIQCLNKEKVLSSENSAMTFLQRLSPAVEKGNNKSLLLNGNKQTPPIKITKVSSLNIGNLSNSQNHIPQKKADSSKLDTSINNAISKLSFMKNPLTKNVNNDFFQTLLKNGKLECNVNKSNDTSLDKNNEDSDDEPELIINEAENEVIDLLSDSEDDSIDLGAPGKRWLYCDVNGIGYVEAQVLKDKKISLRLPFSASTSEFKNFPDATSFINTYVL